MPSEVQGIPFQEALCLQACEDLRDVYFWQVLQDLFDCLDIVGPGCAIHDEKISECQDTLLDECRSLRSENESYIFVPPVPDSSFYLRSVFPAYTAFRDELVDLVHCYEAAVRLPVVKESVHELRELFLEHVPE